MSFKNLLIRPCEMDSVRNFIEEHHYSKSVKGVTPSYCFDILRDGKQIGAAIFGPPAMQETIRKYSENGKFKLLELRRFCLADDTPRNSESRFLGIMLRSLRKAGIERVLSYADPNHGHVGTIYRATGFELLGRTRAITVVWHKDKRWPQRNLWEYRRMTTRSLRRYRSHQDKSLGLRDTAVTLRRALADGTAVLRREQGKFIYLKNLNPAGVTA